MDGRPRAVWLENHVVMDPAGVNISPECAALLAWVSPSGRLRLIDGDEQIDEDPAPRVALAVALDAHLAHRFWVPRPASHSAPPRAPSSPGNHALTPPNVSRPAPPSYSGGHGGGHPTGHGGATSSHGHGSGSGSSGSGADSLGFLNPAGLVAALVIVAGITLVALPPLTFGLANSRPEDSRANAEAIDQVNALNDWLRIANSACATGDAS
ncbi:MAG TPA: hypothetical protein VIA18_33410 [Polyangia bacterium]|nr:hypothetical protein [Polyangia bacterium]